jgi:putative ABC transport system substrate-binding protein
MKRREFIMLLGGAATAWPLAARAQQSMMPVIGVLSGRSLDDSKEFVAAFGQGLNEAGLFEHRNVAIEYRWAENHVDRLPALAAELVQRQVAVILAVGGVPPTQAAKAATSTIPIVFIIGGDPVKLGLVASLNRPGGNVTGVTILSGALTAKRLELLRELRPQASVACLVNPRMSRVAFLHSKEQEAEGVQSGEAAARELGIKLLPAQHTPTDYTDAFALIAREHPDALVVSASAVNVANRRLIVEFAAQRRLPAMYATREFVSAGGLISYGVDFADLFRRAAGYVDRILRGAAPRDLPVEQPTKFDLVINVKTAMALGLDVPPTLLALADEVIE